MMRDNISIILHRKHMTLLVPPGVSHENIQGANSPSPIVTIELLKN